MTIRADRAKRLTRCRPVANSGNIKGHIMHMQILLKVLVVHESILTGIIITRISPICAYDNRNILYASLWACLITCIITRAWNVFVCMMECLLNLIQWNQLNIEYHRASMFSWSACQYFFPTSLTILYLANNSPADYTYQTVLSTTNTGIFQYSLMNILCDKMVQPGLELVLYLFTVWL